MIRQSSCTQAVNWWIIQGPPTRRTRATPTSFGTNVSVISWIWVMVWTTATISPTTRQTTRMGPASFRAMIMAPLRMWTTDVSVTSTSLHTHEERADDQGPSVDEDEEQELDRQRDDHGGQHHHPQRHERGGDHQVDDEEGHEDQESDQERPAQLREGERGDEHPRWDVRTGLRLGCPCDVGEEDHVLILDLPAHVGLERGVPLLRGVRPGDRPVEGRLHRLAVDLGQGRAHGKECQEQGEPDEDLIGRD